MRLTLVVLFLLVGFPGFVQSTQCDRNNVWQTHINEILSHKNVEEFILKHNLTRIHGIEYGGSEPWPTPQGTHYLDYYNLKYTTFSESENVLRECTFIVVLEWISGGPPYCDRILGVSVQQDDFECIPY